MTDVQKPVDRFDERVENWKVNNLKEIRTRVSELPDLIVPTDGPDSRVFSWHVGELSEDQAVTLAKIKVDVGRLFDRIDEQQATLAEQAEKIGQLRGLLRFAARLRNWHGFEEYDGSGVGQGTAAKQVARGDLVIFYIDEVTGVVQEYCRTPEKIERRRSYLRGQVDDVFLGLFDAALLNSRSIRRKGELG